MPLVAPKMDPELGKYSDSFGGLSPLSAGGMGIGSVLLPRTFRDFTKNLTQRLLTRPNVDKEMVKGFLLNAEGHGHDIDKFRKYIPDHLYPFN